MLNVKVLLCAFLLLVLASAASAVPDNGVRLPLQQTPITPAVGELVDVAPFGECRAWDDGKAVGFIWEDARDVIKLVIRFADASSAPDPASARVQYWRASWPRERVPRNQLAGSGGSGWMDVGDWYKGRWKNADAEIKADGATWTITFRPVNEKEFKDVGDFDATYRTTMKVRVVFPSAAPALAEYRAFTDSTWQGTQAIVEWGATTKQAAEVWDGKAEAFNGWVANVRALAGSKAKIADDMSWTSTVRDTTDGLLLDLWYAKSPALQSFDETIVTVRAKQQTFSFDPTVIADGKRIWIRDMGVMIRPVRDASTFDQLEAEYAKAPKDIYRRVTDMPEQTFQHAWDAMPAKGRIYMPLSFEGTRQHFRLNPNGDIALSSLWFNLVKSTDTPRAKWIGDDEIVVKMGMHGGDGATTGASLLNGVLPIATTWYERDGVRCTEEAFATPLSGKLSKEGRVTAEEPMACLVKIEVENKSKEPKTAVLPIGISKQPLEEKDGVVSFVQGGRREVRFVIDARNSPKLAMQDGLVNCSVELGPGQTKAFYVKLPYLTPTDEEVAQLSRLDYDAQRRVIADYWRKRVAAGCQITTPEPMLNDFYNASIIHQLINCESEVGNTGRLIAKVGTLVYEMYVNESTMMASDLDRRGYHDVAERVYETWLHYQGQRELPGDYTSKDGVLYAAGGYEDATGYNQHQGWGLWGLAEHYWFTRDNAWLDRVAPNIVKACDWIIGQRNRTKTAEYAGLRAIEYGLFPPGSLEDIGDWRCWMSNNVFTYWGMQNAAKVLAARNHPEAPRLLKEAESYRQDIRKAFFEAMDRSPIVQLRDGTWIPSVPSDVHRRGRSFGWITETLEGSIHLIRCGVVDPDEPLATWILRDYEDNRYLSDQFGYQPKDFERDWFWMGGFSQQPSLLCSPTPYVMRDEPEHYVRSYFNAFTSAYFPERAMITEHPLPNIGDYRGDHFKTSDEAMNTSWIRWMFIWDEGEDLHLGRVMPRDWLRDGKQVKIERAATHFGPMSMSMASHAASGSIEMTIDPPTRNLPKAIYARFRHPDAKKMGRVTVNGKAWNEFDAAKEWVVLPALKAKTVVVAYYE